jgi:hypothetical protein
VLLLKSLKELYFDYQAFLWCGIIEKMHKLNASYSGQTAKTHHLRAHRVAASLQFFKAQPTPHQNQATRSLRHPVNAASQALCANGLALMIWRFVMACFLHSQYEAFRDTRGFFSNQAAFCCDRIR